MQQGCVGMPYTPKVTMTPDPFPVPILRVRGTGKTQLDLLPVEELREAILAEYPHFQATELPTLLPGGACRPAALRH